MISFTGATPHFIAKKLFNPNFEMTIMMTTLIQIFKPIVEKFPSIAMRYRKMRDKKALIKEPQLIKLGFKFNGNKSMENGLFEVIETELVEKIFPKVDIVINIGANIGYYVCQALQNNKKVFAFEPIETNLKYLLRNIKANNWQENCEVFPVALSNKANIIEIYGGGTGASLIKGWAGISEKFSTLVPCLTINEVLGSRLDGKDIFVIVDIEGAENMMLEGATILLDMNPKPIWLVEINVEEHQPKDVKINPYLLQTFEKFWNRGYKVLTADKHLREISKEEIIHIIEKQKNSLETHNFLFFDNKRKLF
jgi:FkbM family methyltransferase